MAEPWLVRARAARILCNFADYQDLSRSEAPIADRLPDVLLGEGEEVLGLYENTSGQLQEAILVTTQALHIHFAAGWTSIVYTDIKETTGYTTKKEVCGFLDDSYIQEYVGGEIKLQVQGVIVQMADGRHLAIPMRGGRRPYRDAFPFTSFLMRVIRS